MKDGITQPVCGVSTDRLSNSRVSRPFDIVIAILPLGGVEERIWGRHLVANPQLGDLADDIANRADCRGVDADDLRADADLGVRPRESETERPKLTDLRRAALSYVVTLSVTSFTAGPPLYHWIWRMVVAKRQRDRTLRGPQPSAPPCPPR
jgi:hypothetical protein